MRIEESMNPRTTYRWLDYHAGVWRSARCEIVSESPRTMTIRLLGFGPKGRPPGTLMRVHIKSLDLERVVDTTELSWHAWTDI